MFEADQGEATGDARAMQLKGDMIGGPFFELVRAAAPNSDATCAVFTFRDSSLELPDPLPELLNVLTRLFRVILLEPPNS